MNYRLCVRLGVVAGGAVGAILSLTYGLLCCSMPPGPPPIGQVILAGLIVALIAVFIGAAFACLVNHLVKGPVFLLALLIGIVCGVLLAPLAHHIANPGIALFVCALLGALLGWLVCLILCRRGGAKFKAAGIPVRVTR